MHSRLCAGSRWWHPWPASAPVGSSATPWRPWGSSRHVTSCARRERGTAAASQKPPALSISGGGEACSAVCCCSAALLLQVLDGCAHAGRQVFSYQSPVALRDSFFSTQQTNRLRDALQPFGEQLTRGVKQLLIALLPVRE